MVMAFCLLLFFLCLLAADVGAPAAPAVYVNTIGDLVLSPLPLRTVFIGGVDVPATTAALGVRLAQLEALFGQPLHVPDLPEDDDRPVAGVCQCPGSDTDCAVAVKFVSGGTACCSTDTTLTTCRFTGLKGEQALAACRAMILNGGPSNVAFPLYGTSSPVSPSHRGRKKGKKGRECKRTEEEEEEKKKRKRLS